MLSKQFDKLRLKRVLLSGLLVGIVVLMVTGNLPDSELRTRVDAVLGPVRNALGLYQNWAVYADPRTISAYVEAHVREAGGTETIVRLPDSRDLGAYVDYRWQKYEEALRPDDGHDHWAQYASFVASTAERRGQHPVQVTLVRRWAQTLPPGPGAARSPWHSTVMVTIPVAPSP